VLRSVLVAALLAAAFAVPAGATGGAKPVRVTVLEYEFGFKLSRHTVPPGKVTFVMGNEGAIIHNFDIVGVAEGPFLVPGQSALMTVSLKKDTYTYVCSVKYHAAQGMEGTLYVK
jgi:plastocyanin